MTETQPIVDPPPRGAYAAFVAGVVADAIALILLLLGYTNAGIGFVALGLLLGLVGIFRSRSSGPGGGLRQTAPPPNPADRETR